MAEPQHLTGPEHYREAERLLAVAAGADGADTLAPLVVAAAQVHATLAAAAATVDAARGHLAHYPDPARWGEARP